MLHALAWAVQPFMLWNTVLAFVPFGLAIILFRRGVARTPLWWLGFATWIAFLPNAPYVVTDVVHLVDDMQRTQADRHAYALLAVYGTFFACGLVLYGLSTWLCERALVSWIGTVRVQIVIVALHLACAIGVYLGRFARLNSWEVYTDPVRVGVHVGDLDERFPLIVIAMMFGALVAATFVMRVTARAGASAVTRVMRGTR